MLGWTRERSYSEDGQRKRTARTVTMTDNEMTSFFFISSNGLRHKSQKEFRLLSFHDFDFARAPPMCREKVELELSANLKTETANLRSSSLTKKPLPEEVSHQRRLAVQNPALAQSINPAS